MTDQHKLPQAEARAVGSSPSCLDGVERCEGEAMPSQLRDEVRPPQYGQLVAL